LSIWTLCKFVQALIGATVQIVLVALFFTFAKVHVCILKANIGKSHAKILILTMLL